MTAAGYSGKTLVQKMGIKTGMRLIALNPPDNYMDLIQDLPVGVDLATTLTGKFDLIHAFFKRREEFEENFSLMKESIIPAGAIWISWLKAAAKIPTDMNENVVRNYALAHEMVDVKVAAVDALWSGLKLVIRVENRK